MDKRVPFFFSAFCSMMVGSSVLHTTAGVMLAGVGASAAERVQAVFTAANASGFSAPEIAPLAEVKAIKTGYVEAKASVTTGTDKIMVGIADAIERDGESAVLERGWVRNLNIPITQPGDGPLSIKRMQTEGVSRSGSKWYRTAIVIVTDKRYVIFNMELGPAFNGIAVDETATPIAGRYYRPMEGPMEDSALASRLRADRPFWADKLLHETVASTGI